MTILIAAVLAVVSLLAVAWATGGPQADAERRALFGNPDAPHPDRVFPDRGGRS
ncbi:hypothetical protein [Actinosynnema sp. NPDC023587]|uniref:hypothetical protein n=1 Tax=Actinosynnema sp. NPDC023587 TaxID=3154695 RepID=UPI0033D884B6